jgi:hypothetical protein
MYNNKIRVIALVLIVIGLLTTTHFLDKHITTDEVSFCDSIVVQKGYEGNAICYEPIEDFYVGQKLVRLNN